MPNVFVIFLREFDDIEGWVVLEGRKGPEYAAQREMNPLAVIQDHATEIRALGARRIGVFGSFARGEGRDDSDIDIFIEFEDPKRTYDNFFALHDLLETLLGRRVDLVTDKALTETKARLILPTVRYARLHG